jgi:Rrf2 family protein
MKLSLRGEYALRALQVLGENYEHGKVVPIQVISQEQNIPHRFLQQILNDLKSAGFAESRRGLAGGYRLGRPPENITLAQVIRHIEGALAPVGCVSQHFYRKCSCPDERQCAIRSVMKEVRDSIVLILEKTTLAELCHRASQLRVEPLQTLDYVI